MSAPDLLESRIARRERILLSVATGNGDPIRLVNGRGLCDLRRGAEAAAPPAINRSVEKAAPQPDTKEDPLPPGPRELEELEVAEPQGQHAESWTSSLSRCSDVRVSAPDLPELELARRERILLHVSVGAGYPHKSSTAQGCATPAGLRKRQRPRLSITRRGMPTRTVNWKRIRSRRALGRSRRSGWRSREDMIVTDIQHKNSYSPG
jgi:hypothetical protein